MIIDRANTEVWKWEIGPDVVNFIDMPEGAQIIRVATQHIPENHGAHFAHGPMEKPCIWAVVNPLVPTKQRLFRIAGTGHPLGDYDTDIHLEYAGSFSLRGPMEYHVFELVQH